MSEATPRPWELEENVALANKHGRSGMDWKFERTEENDVDGLEGAGIVTSSHSIFAYLTCDRQHAEFIHNAVNTYDEREALIRELVAALEAVLLRYRRALCANGFSPQRIDRCWEVGASNNALDKAKDMMPPPHRTDSTTAEPAG